MDRNQLEKVLSTKMNRREFIQYLGVLLASLVGVSKLASMLKKPLSNKSSTKVKVDSGYGSNPYGK